MACCETARSKDVLQGMHTMMMKILSLMFLNYMVRVKKFVHITNAHDDVNIDAGTRDMTSAPLTYV